LKTIECFAKSADTWWTMIIECFYLSSLPNVDKALKLTGLSLDEIETVVGRFRKDHYRFAGLMKGEVIKMVDGSVKLRHHFTKKVIWSNENKYL
jgi:hypothetical protein